MDNFQNPLDIVDDRAIFASVKLDDTLVVRNLRKLREPQRAPQKRRPKVVWISRHSPNRYALAVIWHIHGIKSKDVVVRDTREEGVAIRAIASKCPRTYIVAPKAELIRLALSGKSFYFMEGGGMDESFKPTVVWRVDNGKIEQAWPNAVEAHYLDRLNADAEAFGEDIPLGLEIAIAHFGEPWRTPEEIQLLAGITQEEYHHVLKSATEGVYLRKKPIPAPLSWGLPYKLEE